MKSLFTVYSTLYYVVTSGVKYLIESQLFSLLNEYVKLVLKYKNIQCKEYKIKATESSYATCPHSSSLPDKHAKCS